MLQQNRARRASAQGNEAFTCSRLWPQFIAPLLLQRHSDMWLLSAAVSFVQISACGRTFVASAEPPVVIDLRPAEQFQRTHLAGACHLPLGDLSSRLFELPPPGEWPVALVGSSDELAAARATLIPKGWALTELDASEPSTWAPDTTASGSGAGGRSLAASTAATSASPYRPNSFLDAALTAALPGLHATDAPGTVVDLGCGSGRDAVFLASALADTAPAWRVLGLDNHRAALGRARALAERVASPACVQFEEVDLRKGGLEMALSRRPDEPLRLVHGCRWLDVKLLASLPPLMAPGGLFLWSTFLDPPDGSEPLAPPYRRSRRLSSGQMRQLIGEAQGMEVLYDGEGQLLTRSTWVTAQFFAARRRITT